MSSSDAATPSEVLLIPLVWNLNGGPWLSGAGFVIPNWKDCALLLARLGRKNVGRLLLQETCD
jgi:uncharacterized membrane protein YkgB